MTADGGRDEAEREGFLARWSRRKRAAGGGGAAEPDDPAPQPAASTPADRAPRPDDPPPAAAPGLLGPAAGATDSEEARRPAAPPLPPPPSSPAFDPASLPPVESLTAGSDIHDFLRAEVPQALRRAALRRIWSLDPAIRDFVGPADYAWDFNAPDGVPGFAPTLDGAAGRLLARAAGLEDGGEAARDAGVADPAAATPAPPPADLLPAAAPPPPPATDDPSASPPAAGPVAPPAEAEPSPARPRRHGGARPA
jgi:hypothetical protein